MKGDYGGDGGKGFKGKGNPWGGKGGGGFGGKALVKKAGAEKAKEAGAAKENAGDVRETASSVVKRAIKRQSVDQPRKTLT